MAELLPVIAALCVNISSLTCNTPAMVPAGDGKVKDIQWVWCLGVPGGLGNIFSGNTKEFSSVELVTPWHLRISGSKWVAHFPNSSLLPFYPASGKNFGWLHCKGCFREAKLSRVNYSQVVGDHFVRLCWSHWGKCQWKSCFPRDFSFSPIWELALWNGGLGIIWPSWHTIGSIWMGCMTENLCRDMRLIYSVTMFGTQNNSNHKSSVPIDMNGNEINPWQPPPKTMLIVCFLIIKIALAYNLL